MTGIPRVAVWTGRGASYSWIWWADLLEDLHWLKAVFHVEARTLEGDLDHRDLLLLGGGDVAALRSALDFDRIREWVEGGGRLVATCAGGYLLRDWAGVSIANVAEEPPEGASAGAWTHCEGGIVVHPVRGPVSLASSRGASFTAPVYGGPVFHEVNGGLALVAARYAGVTRGAVWLLADRPDMLQGTPAVVTAPLGKGLVVLAGPHLEHPDHPAAHLWLSSLLGWEPGTPEDAGLRARQGTDPKGEEVVRRLASVRGRANSIANVSWRSGEKMWSGERVAGFADAVIPRARRLAHWGWAPRGRASALLPLLEAAADRMGARNRPEAWDQGFAALSEAGSIMMDAYFASRRAGMRPPPQRIKRPSRLAPEGGFNAPTAPYPGEVSRR